MKSKFRLLVEDILKDVNKDTTEYTYLTPELQNAITKWYENLNIDISELPSAHYDNNPYDVEPQLAGGSGMWFADEDEEYNAKIDKAIEYITADGIEQYIDESLLPFTFADWDADTDILAEKLNAEVIDFLQKQKILK